MSLDEPIVLSIGTEVSAKYKGAFCEAKIKKVLRLVRCKVTTKADSSSLTINEDDVENGLIRVGQAVNFKEIVGNSVQISEATINKILDQSQYTVVFDDGDEATLKRTSLCLKSGKHFAESDTLDQLPLTHPEHFSNPVSLGRRCRRRQNAFSPVTPVRRKQQSKAKIQSDSEDETLKNSPGFKKNVRKSLKLKSNSDVGKVVCVEYGDKRGFKNKDVWFPAYVVSVSSDSPKNKETTEYKVRSFRDDRYYDVSKKDARSFDKDQIKSSYLNSDYSSELRSAIEKALGYIENGVFPFNWDNMHDLELQEDGEDSRDDENCNASTSKSGSGRNICKKFADDEDNDEDEDDDDSEDSDSDLDVEIGDDDDEEEIQERQRRQQKQLEERDMFVAKLYKFMDDRGTPINSCPSVNGKELNLYKLYRIVHKMGGPNRITNKNSWKRVVNKLGLAGNDIAGTSMSSESTTNEIKESDDDSEDGINPTDSPISQLKSAYKKYLHPFHELNRKLGPAPVLVDSRFSRSISRPSRGERKREEERSRVNSVSSISSNFSTPTSSNVRKTVTSTSKSTTKSAPNKTSTENNETTPVSSAPNNATLSTGNNSNNVKQTKDKNEDKKRKKKDLEVIDSICIEKKEDTENDDSQMTGSSSVIDGDSDDEDSNNSNKLSKIDESEISVNDGLSVLYGKGKQMKVYEAKVLKINCEQPSGRRKFLVHYYGWSSRYDEWITKARITQIVRDKSPRRRSGKVKNKGEPLPIDSIIYQESSDLPEQSEPPLRSRKSSIKSDTGKDSENLKQRSRLNDNSKVEPKASKSTTSDADKRNRIKEEPKEHRERSSSVNKSKAEDTPRRSRTQSLSQKEPLSRKDKTSIKTEDRQSVTGTPSGKRSKATNIECTTPSNQKGKNSKVLSRKTESDDDLTKMSAKKDKKKDVDKTPTIDSKKDKVLKEPPKRALDQDDSSSSNTKELCEDSESFLKRKRTDESSSSKGRSNSAESSNSSTKTQQTKPALPGGDAYDFVDDEEVVTEPKCETSCQKTSAKGYVILDLAKKEFSPKNRPQSAASIDPPESSLFSNKPETVVAIKSSPAVKSEDISEQENFTVKETDSSPSVVVSKSESPQDFKPIIVEAEGEPIQAENFISENSTVYSLQSSGEDLEVENILSNTDKNSSPTNLADNDETNNSNSAQLNSDLSSQIKTEEFDNDIDRSSPGQLVVAEDDDEEAMEVDEDDEKIKNPTCFSEKQQVSTEQLIDKSEDKMMESSTKEASQSERVDNQEEDSKVKESDSSTSSVDSLLLCEETVPASPPASPPPISSQTPEECSNLHHPASSQSLPGDYFRGQMSVPPSNSSLEISNMQKYITPDQVGMESSQEPKAFAPPAFLANMHRSPFVQASPQSVIKSNIISNFTPNITQHQSFSKLIAAASQQSIGSQPKSASSSKSPAKSLNVIVPPNIASNIMKLDRKLSVQNEDDEIDDDEDQDIEDDHAAGVEADVDECEDDENDEESSSRQCTPRKPKTSERKRRNMRTSSKLSSSAAPTIGILSSQESSQDGDDHSIEDSLKMQTDEMFHGDKKVSQALKSKSSGKRGLSSSTTDIKNEDDSSSGGHTRGDKENKHFISPAPSPKKRRRGRIRTVSQSDTRDLPSSNNNFVKERSNGCKTRGRYRHNSGLNHADYHNSSNNSANENFLLRDNSCLNSDHSSSSHHNSSSHNQSILNSMNAPRPQPVDYNLLSSYKPKSKFNFLAPIDMSMCSEERCKILLNRLREMRKIYNEYKRKQANRERKKKKASRKLKENEKKNQKDLSKSASASSTTGNIAGNSGSESSSSSKNERSSRSKRDLSSKQTKDEPSNAAVANKDSKETVKSEIAVKSND